jgi:hypothetical protein
MSQSGSRWGDCTSGGTTYLQPVNETPVGAYGLTLRTSGGGGTPQPTSCSGYEATYSGSGVQRWQLIPAELAPAPATATE